MFEQFERLGYTRPLIRLPVSLVYSAGRTLAYFSLHSFNRHHHQKEYFESIECKIMVCVCVCSVPDGAVTRGSEARDGDPSAPDQKRGPKHSFTPLFLSVFLTRCSLPFIIHPVKDVTGGR